MDMSMRKQIMQQMAATTSRRRDPETDLVGSMSMIAVIKPSTPTNWKGHNARNEKVKVQEKKVQLLRFCIIFYITTSILFYSKWMARKNTVWLRQKLIQQSLGGKTIASGERLDTADTILRKVQFVSWIKNVSSSTPIRNKKKKKERKKKISITWLSRPRVSSIKKKRAAQRGASGIRVTALG